MKNLCVPHGPTQTFSPADLVGGKKNRELPSIKGDFPLRNSGVITGYLI
jgi:hypothetical protein